MEREKKKNVRNAFEFNMVYDYKRLSIHLQTIIIAAI